MTPHRRDILKGTASAFLAASALSQTTAAHEDWEDELAREIPDPEEISVATGRDGVAATSHPLATEAAVEILEDGGNAYDAAAAAELALCVVEPNGTGLSAEARMHTYNAKEDVTYLVDGLGRAAGAAQPEMFLDEDGEPLPTQEVYDRGLAHGVPGVVRLHDTALKRWGTKYFDEVAQPAIELAEEGWEIDRELSLRIHQAHRDDTLNEAAEEVYYDDDGEPLEPGDLLVQEDLGHSLQLIAEHGSDAFYQGEIAEATAEFIQDMGGVTTLEDFQRYQVSIDHPIWFEYDDYQVSGEYQVGLALRLIEGFDIDDLDPTDPDRYHLLLEAMDLAGSDAGAHVGDLEFTDIPQQGLLSDEYTEDRRDLINLDSVSGVGAGDPWAYQPGNDYRTDGHVSQSTNESITTEPEFRTNSFVVADEEGNVVTHTSSLGVGWYAGNMVPGYGFILSVIQSYFSSAPEGINSIAPNKRNPGAKVMTPTIVYEDGQPIMTADSPGAVQSAPFQVLVNVLEHDMGLADAVAEPRVQPGWDGVTWEDGVPKQALWELQDRGHGNDDEDIENYEWADLGSVQSIVRQDRGRGQGQGPRWTAAADARRDGGAAAAGDDDRRGPPEDVPGRGSN